MHASRFLLFPVLLLAAPSLPAQDDGAVNCIELSRITGTEVIDSQNVIFTMRDGTSYLNTLPHMCAGLSESDTILFRSTIDQLCNVDTISTMQKFGGGYQAGAACGLGRFQPIGKAEIEVIRLRLKTEREMNGQ